jgi:chromosome segregation ATPase
MTTEFVSAAALQELEATLEAAFADPRAAESLRGGRLSSGLHYSGLGFSAQIQSESPSRTTGGASTRNTGSEADQIAAQRNLGKANREVEQADAEVKKATQAVAEAADELTRLKSAEALAVRRSKDAHDRASVARKTLSKRH